jgi:hypothetical protein
MRDTQRRATGGNGSILVHANVVHRVIDSAEVYGRCEKLLIYARGGDDMPATPIIAGDVKRALFLMTTGISDVEELEKEIDRFASVGENGNPWPEH